MYMPVSPEFYWAAVALVSIASTARITRLLVFDKFPPVMAVREKFVIWADKTERRRGYQLLALCGYCMAFWVAVLVLGAADLSGVLDGKPLAAWMTPAWWITNSIFAVAYLGAIMMRFDGDNSQGGL